MLKFGLAAFFPAYLFGYWLEEPGQYRAAGAIGVAVFLLAIGMITIHIAKRRKSQTPYRSAMAIMAVAAIFATVDRQSDKHASGAAPDTLDEMTSKKPDDRWSRMTDDQFMEELLGESLENFSAAAPRPRGQNHERARVR